MRKRALVLLGGLALACGPLEAPPPPVAPVNACPGHACASYAPYDPGEQATCNAGICEVAKQLDYVLVVSVPDTSFFAPDTTFAVASSDLFSAPDSKCSESGTPTLTTPCSRLPEVATVAGEYVVDPYVEYNDAVYYLGAAGDVALPVQVTYRPLSPNGLPLLPVVALVSIGNEALATGPSGGPVIEFQASLAPGNYEVTVMPDAPYDSAYPPDVDDVAISSGNAGLRADLLENTDKVTGQSLMIHDGDPYFVISVDGSEPQPLDGGEAYLRDAVTKRQVSNVVTFGASNRTDSPLSYTVVLNTNHHPPPASPGGEGDAILGTELVVEPPPTSLARPTLVIPEVGNMLGPAITYPEVPQPVVVAGTVTSSADGSALKADVVLTATSLDVSNMIDARLEPDLGFVARLTTDDDGNYTVTLPPPPPGGTYSVVITPADPAYGKATTTLAVDVSPGEQAGKSLFVDPKRGLHGKAVVSDGRPLAGARVTASVSATAQAEGSPDTSPRAAQTTTADDGTFALSLDPGSYDITVRPADGSRLPWFVSTSRVVGATDVTLETFEIPAPIVASLVLEDPNDNPIPSAVVRVYATAPASTAMGAPPPPYVEIGEAITDAEGRYEMYLAGEPR